MRDPLGPPKDLDPGETWMRMTELPRPVSDPVVLRARGQDVAVLRFWTPTAREVALASARAAKAAGPEDELLDAVVLLRLVARDPFRVERPLFRSEAEIGALTSEEIGAAIRQYAAFRASCGPVIDRLSRVAYEEWVEFLKLGAEQFYFEAARWGNSDTPFAVPGVEPANLCDCHFLCWIAARRVLYPDAGRAR